MADNPSCMHETHDWETYRLYVIKSLEKNDSGHAEILDGLNTLKAMFTTFETNTSIRLKNLEEKNRNSFKQGIYSFVGGAVVIIIALISGGIISF